MALRGFQQSIQFRLGYTLSVQPSNTTRTTEVAGELGADFLRNHQRLVDGIGPEEIRPGRLGVVPGIRRLGVGIERRRVIGAALGNEVLLDETAALVAADFTVVDLLHTLVGVLVALCSHRGAKPVSFVEVFPVSSCCNVRDCHRRNIKLLGYRFSAKAKINVSVYG